EEVLKIGGRKHQHLSRSIASEKVITPARLRHFDPARKVLLLLFWFLRKEIVGDAQGHFAATMQFLNDRVILWIILKTAPCIDDAGEAETVQLPHEMARGIQLVFRRKLR